jgi:hypothetical protein
MAEPELVFAEKLSVRVTGTDTGCELNPASVLVLVFVPRLLQDTAIDAVFGLAL